MTVLSDLEIKRAIVEGHVVLRPLVPENIKGSSIDVTLGEWFWRCDADAHGVFNPRSKAEVERYFAGPYQAKPYASVYDKIGREDLRHRWPIPAGREYGTEYRRASSPFENVPDDWPVIVLRPGERILAHTHEFVGIRAPGTSMMKARSSSGRIGLAVCDDAGWGDPDYVFRWTLEIWNRNHEALIVPVGMRVGQVVLFHTGVVGSSYASEGKYQPRDLTVEEMAKMWTPTAMLPRIYEDEVADPVDPLDGVRYLDSLARLQGELDELPLHWTES